MSFVVIIVLLICLLAMPFMIATMRLEVYGYLLALKPLDYEGWTYYGKLLKENGHYQRAHYALMQGLAIRPNHSEAWFQLSELYSQLEFHDRADDALARAIESEVQDAE